MTENREARIKRQRQEVADIECAKIRAKKNGIARIGALYLIWDGEKMWDVSRNPEISGGAKWTAYCQSDQYTYLDPQYYLWEIKSILLGWKDGYRPK